MKERSLPNQYLMLEAIKARFDATEAKTGMERARELAERAELTEGDSPQELRANDSRGNGAESESPSVSLDQPGLWEAA